MKKNPPIFIVRDVAARGACAESRKVRKRTDASGAEPRKPTVTGSRQRRPVASPWRWHGERVPQPPPSPHHSPCGALPAAAGHENPPSRRDTKTTAVRSARKESPPRPSCPSPTLPRSLFPVPCFHLNFVLGRRPFRVPRSGVSCPTEAAAMRRIARAWDGGGHARMGRRSLLPARTPMAARRDGGFRGRAKALVTNGKIIVP